MFSGPQAIGSVRDGGQHHCASFLGQQRCTQAVRWEGTYWPLDPGLGYKWSWMGSLLENKRDPSGLLYRRHRYLDTQAGRFTQEDPIGLAGGLNAYNYADGDPVNFEDPFGLCPYFLTGKPCSAGAAIAFGFVPIAGDFYDVASAIAGKDLLTGESIGGVGVAATFIGTIAGSGKLAREGVGFGGRLLKGVAAPTLDATGKLHGALPGHVPGNWTSGQLEELAGDLRSSISTRKLEQARLGEHGPHRRRIFEEERLLRQVEKKLSGS